MSLRREGTSADELLGSWAWGPSRLERACINRTWDDKLWAFTTGDNGDNVCGLLVPDSNGYQTTLFVNGHPTGFVMQWRARPPGKMAVTLKLAGTSRILREYVAARLPQEPARQQLLGLGSGEVELELHLVRVGGLAARAWHRPTGARRADAAVVVCPGVPSPMLRGHHAGSALITEIEMAFVEQQVPIVCFDYSGVGASSHPLGGSRQNAAKWRPPSDDQAVRDVEAVVEWAKERLSDSVLVCGFSRGAMYALSVALSKNLSGYISISMGVPGSSGSRQERERFASAMEVQTKLTCQALHVVGERDTSTSVQEVQRLARAREDGGAGVAVRVLKSAGHSLKGLEEEAASLCAGWAAGLRQGTAHGARGPPEASEVQAQTEQADERSTGQAPLAPEALARQEEVHGAGRAPPAAEAPAPAKLACGTHRLPEDPEASEVDSPRCASDGSTLPHQPFSRANSGSASSGDESDSHMTESEEYYMTQVSNDPW